MTERPLPPLPHAIVIDRHVGTGVRIYGYTAEQMREYAGTALFADRAQAQPEGWINVDDRSPATGTPVLACYKNSAGKLRLIRASWVAAKSHESSPDSEIGEYDEELDCYFDPEGWYEKIDNWDDYSAIAVHEPVTHWMLLPAAPQPPEPT